MRLLICSMLIGAGLWLGPVAAGAQDEPRADTTAAVSEQSESLRNLLEQQRLDSIKRKELENRLLSIELGDRREKQRLLEEINLLKSRDSIILAQRKQKVDSLRALNQGVPIVPFRDTVFIIYTSLGSYSAKERAAAVESRIKALANNYEFGVDSLQLEEQENHFLVRWRDQMVVSVNDQDALWMNTDVASLADHYLAAIKESIATYRDETSMKRVLMGVLQAVLIVLVVFLLIKGITRLAGFVKRKALAAKQTWFKGIRMRGYELVSANRQVKAAWIIIDIAKWLLILALIYLALPLLFNLFPATRGYAPVLLGYFLAPIKEIGLAAVDYFPDLITIAVICFMFRYFLKLLKFFAHELQNGALTVPGFYADWAMPTYQILRVLLLAFMVIVIFPYLPGSESPIFKGVSVFIGVLFTFGSAGALSNIVAGLVLTYMRSFTVGDRVKIGEVTGDIIEKSLLVTRIRTVKNEVISVPNSQVMNSHTINYSMDAPEKGLIIHTNITMGYDITWQRVHELATRAAAKVELLESDPAPFVLQSSLDDFYVTYQVNAYTKSPNKQAIIYSELHKHLLDEFHGAGIELLSPHFRAVRANDTREMPDQG
ncbi:MAG TPA: mechanosensitive ion channel domain-containing protein [Parapedobacter sp.]|uniref:mechanosensitive ion channel family protein n=1 Tax=Parapedobacter sp. TaxID=1958893 RepID=UPI002D0B5641|nr:mechanosensitive ion channel domain-containing protein [Parapedobacter sp.]HWK57474.1 mechanosensitive ion channel domain-containing protein [Parapedobacter sp.]